jgi:hypothetical protein
MTATRTENLSELALTACEFSDAGVSVIPIRENKKSSVKWQKYQQERATFDELTSWFYGAQTHSGLAVVCGAISKNLEMLEVEGRGMNLLHEITQLLNEAQVGDAWKRITNGYLELSPKEGLHVLYLVDGVVSGNTKLASTIDGEPLIETRGEGGYCVVAPSGGKAHPNGKSWKLINGGPSTIATITAKERDTIHAVLRSFNLEPQQDHKEPQAKDLTATSGTRPGDDYNRKTTWDELLPSYGWKKLSTKSSGEVSWLRPGKDPKEGGHSATTNFQGNNRLKVWSTGTILPTEGTLTQYAFYSYMEHGGDFAQAARELRRQGYGDLETPPPLTLEMSTAESTSTDESSDGWTVHKIDDYLGETKEPLKPIYLTRPDGVSLFYPGMVNEIHGESESGKSLIVQYLTAQEVHKGTRVLYIDLESDPTSLFARLKEFGATTEELRQHLTLTSYEQSHLTQQGKTHLEKMLETVWDLVIVDTVGESIALAGMDSNSNDDVTKWHRTLPRRFAALGACVVLVDHVGKGRGIDKRMANGAMSKRAKVQGSSYVVKVGKPLGKGIRGEIGLYVAKDRPGEIRGKCGKKERDETQEAARIVFDSTGTNIDVEILEPSTRIGEADKPFRPTSLMEKASKALELSYDGLTQDALAKEIGGRRQYALEAVVLLIAENYVEVVEVSGKKIHKSLTQYRQASDPLSDHYVGGES